MEPFGYYDASNLKAEPVYQKPYKGIRCLNLLDKVHLKSRRKKRNSMTGPGQPRTCSHPVYA